VGFFDSVPPPPPPEPEPPAPPRPVWVKPETQVGGSVGVDLLLARSDEAALALTGLIAYPNGFSFTIAAVLREEDRRGRVHHYGYQPDGSGAPEPEFLRVGVRFADGRVAANLAGRPRFDDETPDRPVLMADSGGGGGRRFDMGYWVWPLPPAGPLTVVVAWPGYHIDETSAQIDAALLHDAAGRAISLD
jgi:hypothetical protein